MPMCSQCNITIDDESADTNECGVSVFVCLSDAIHTTTVRTTVRNAPACETRTVCTCLFSRTAHLSAVNRVRDFPIFSFSFATEKKLYDNMAPSVMMRGLLPSCQSGVSSLTPLDPCTCPSEVHVLCVCVCACVAQVCRSPFF